MLEGSMMCMILFLLFLQLKSARPQNALNAHQQGSQRMNGALNSNGWNGETYHPYSMSMFQSSNNDGYPGLSNPTNYSNNSPTSSTANVMVQLSLKSYQDQNMQLPNGMTCICPTGFSCDYLGSVEARCLFSFTIILSSPDSSVKYVSTDFLPLTSSGTIDMSNMKQEQINSWQQMYTFYLTSEPSAVDVFVHHMGVVINQATGQLAQIRGVVHVDTFILPLYQAYNVNNNSMNSGLGTFGSISTSGDSQTTTLTGIILGTQLQLSYSVLCLGNLVGPKCDLICNTSSQSSSVAICQSNSTGFYYQCSYGSNGQVKNCMACPWGIAEGAYCSNSNGGVLNPAAAGVVSSSFRVATIVLGVVAGVLLILLILVTIYSCVLVNRRMRAEERASDNANGNAPGHNYRSTIRSEGSANRPLLQTGYNGQHTGPLAHIPVATSRPVPSLDIMPAKSALRKPNPIPPAHLGGGSSLNDTLNSTLSSVPLPPSKEADV